MQQDAVAGALLGLCRWRCPLDCLTRHCPGNEECGFWGEPNRPSIRVWSWHGVGMTLKHTCMVAQSLCRYPNDTAGFFQAIFARRLRWWLLGVPAGIGSATFAIHPESSGLVSSPSRSGVFSAGKRTRRCEAPCWVPRSTILDQLRSFIRASTLITHTDPKALRGAWVIALAAWWRETGLLTRSKSILPLFAPVPAVENEEEVCHASDSN